ncbi:MAG TPA: metalloregulator ArsR/SmtB family transcription factor [Leptospiraceae bacterium]|jgi:DNA-binding transcriptional ArsR family regulator|nr:metalloregulator ArsR/SmtB family transcription factor [Leptospirales bacterium]HMU85052.1 metalloregulator ArsR/SmtB family transcription factor [Leptospiraceae bacterium]HMW62008.1 metalloregulator ArsR/SmtB family transcription factor [Leptospiraceae bacterium]HMX57764.1 metalloregulator ArsR/SmtB family transcription factor [Leptospiraceae bacterium]HMZ36869.1 metalloregulator ArsR/SmtB family transcription factor [Leptospiraceae bacterium]
MITKAAEFPATLNELADFAKALSHPARTQILKTVAKRGECVCGEIVDVMPLAQSTVSQHLKDLKGIGLIKGETEGKTSCYCIDWKAMKRFKSLASQFFEEMEKFEKSNCC